MQLSFKQIRYFLAAAETGQFSVAAAKVHVTQSAITASIRELEELLGCALFERQHAAGVSLTAEGQQFLVHAKNIAAAVSGALADPNLQQKNLSGCLEIAATHSILGSYLIPAYGRFRKSFPGVELKLIELSRAEIESNLIKHRLDAGIMWLANLERSDVLDSIVLTRSRRQLWLGADHPLLSKRGVSLKDISSEPYVLYDVDDTPQNTRRFWASAKSRPNIVYRVTSVEAVRSLVAQGLAITVLSDVVFRPFSTEGQRIFTRPLLDALPAIEVGLVWPRGTVPSVAFSVFKSFMEHSFSGPGNNSRNV
jgi:DNA-binding transcriptional LysR family regulator